MARADPAVLRSTRNVSGACRPAHCAGDFRRLWADHQVQAKTYDRKRIRHPVAGDLDLTYETLALPGDQDQTMIVYTAPPGSAIAERLAMLARRTATAASPAGTA